MTTTTLIESLLAAGREVSYHEIKREVARLPGAGVHERVSRFSESVGGRQLLHEIASWPVADRAAFTKALAVYEYTVGGLGSASVLQYLFGLFKGSTEVAYETLRWLQFWIPDFNSWYIRNAIEPEKAALRYEEQRIANEKKIYELAAPARTLRAERATVNLYNAVRRGDLKAVDALLRKGASPLATTPDGVLLTQYAESMGRGDIALILTSFPEAPASPTPT